MVTNGFAKRFHTGFVTHFRDVGCQQLISEACLTSVLWLMRFQLDLDQMADTRTVTFRKCLP